MQINSLLYLLFCSIGTNKSKKIKHYLIDSIKIGFKHSLWSWFIFIFSLFLPSLPLCLSLFLVNVKHDIEREIFMRFPFMSTHSYPFIIYLAIKGICLLISVLCQQAFAAKLLIFLGSKAMEVLE